MDKFFKKAEHNLVIQIVFFVVSMALILVGYFIGIEKIFYSRVANREIIEDASVTRDFYKVSVTNKTLSLSGWVLKKDAIVCDIQLILLGDDDSDVILLKTSTKSSEDINKYFSDNWNYGEVLFNAEIMRNKLEKNICYEIIFELSYEVEASMNRYIRNIRTGKYLYNEEIYAYNPKTFIEPMFEDELMNSVIKEGEICFYDIEETIYVYKYGDKLYWIAGSEFDFNLEGKTYISYQIGTTMPEKLPEHRQIHEYENWDFYFEDREYFIENSKYRVAIHNIPIDFPVTYYYTAIYDFENKTLIWKKYFNLPYNLE